MTVVGAGARLRRHAGEGSAVLARVMVCDDDRVIRGLLEVNLEMEGHGVVSAVDGQDALDKARADPPDLIILDVMMPNLDGWQTAEVLRTDERTRDVPIIFLSARASESDYRRSTELDVEHYVAKPFDPGELMTLVNGLVGGA